MARTRKKEDTLDFEASLKKLEAIVRRLEEEQVPLEESLALFAEGKKLARSCQDELQRAETRVRQLIEDAEGNLTEEPLDAPDEEDAPCENAPHSGEAAPEKPPEAKSANDLPF